MTVSRALALTLAFGLLAACDDPPTPPAPVPAPPKTESAPPAEVAPPAPVESAEPAPQVIASVAAPAPAVAPAPPPATKPAPEAQAETRAAPPDKAPAAARRIPRAEEKVAAKAKPQAKPAPAPLPPVKLDLRLPDELVQGLTPGEPLEQLPAQESLLPPLFVDKPDEPGPYQLNGRLITNDRVDDYWESVEGAELQIEFRN